MNRRNLTWLATGASVALMASLTTVAVAEGADRTGRVTACADKKTGALRLSKPACRGSETRLRWAARGPAGAAGPVGPAGPVGRAGALATTPVAVRYDATRSTPHQLTAVGGVLLHLECGTNRIGSSSIDLGIFTDEIHGSSTITNYSAGGTVVGSKTYAFDRRSSADLESPGVGGSVAYVTHQVQAIVSEGGVVSQVIMYLSRDSREGRPACEFIGSVTELGPVTVSPS